MAVVKDMYSHFGWELSSEGLEHMQGHLEENRQNKLGKHSYNIAEWGITEDDLKDTLPEYLEFFGTKENML